MFVCVKRLPYKVRVERVCIPKRGSRVPVAIWLACVVDSVSGRLADSDCRLRPALFCWATPRLFRLNIHVNCSVQSLGGRAAVQGQAVEALLSCIPMAFVSGRVWAAKNSVDGRVPLKIEGYGHRRVPF